MRKSDREILDTGKCAAIEAGQILMENFGKVSKITEKSDGSLVTNVDIEAERKIIGVIRGKFPEHSILTEETDGVSGGSEYRWIVDPLDGTHNYIRGLDIFGVSISVTRENEPFIGILHFPSWDKLYHCEKGKGAYLNGKRIRVSRKELEQALITHNSNFRIPEAQRMFERFRKLVSCTFKVRMFGSCIAHLSQIAEGRLDIDVEYGLNPWDFFAGALMVEEAGGRVTDFSGGPWHLSNGSIVASNGLVHDKILKLLDASGGTH